MDYRIFPPEEFLEARVELPLSKSMSARALIINALTADAAPMGPVAECDDTAALKAALEAYRAGESEVNTGHAGTTMRFLAAYFAATEGANVTLDGSEQMRRRPVGGLVEALRALGADVEYVDREGFPPLRIRGRRLKGGEMRIDASVSSQFISALMLVAPTFEAPLQIELEGTPTSRSYIEMTAELMRRAGVEAELYRNTVSVANTPYRPSPITIEGDWSAAAAWYEIEALAAGTVELTNVAEASCQGDRRVADIFAKMGVDTCWEGENGGVDLVANPDPDARVAMDFAENPDVVPYAVVTCVMLGLPFRFSGLHTLRVKETDRIAALQTEMARLGVELTTPTLPNDPSAVILEWDGRRRPILEEPVFETYDDHRMAMCVAPVAIYLPGIVVKDAEVVSKSYSGYWDALVEAGFTVEEVGE